MEQTTVLPGDRVLLGSSCSVIGPGLVGSQKDQPQTVHAVNCGLLRHRTEENADGDKSNIAAWIDCDNHRYVPVFGDHVVGQVVQKVGAEGWKVEIGCAELANLSNLSFEGATKRNRPDVKLGDLVYGHVTQTIEPEMVCISEDRRARSFGVLPSSGWLIRSSPSHVRKLLSVNCNLFTLLGKKAPFEVTCGVNGWMWVKAHSLKQTIFVTKAIEMSRHLSNDQMRDLVERSEKEQLKAFTLVG